VRILKRVENIPLDVFERLKLNGCAFYLFGCLFPNLAEVASYEHSCLKKLGTLVQNGSIRRMCIDPQRCERLLG
jgi:hypothetical protein